MPTIHLKFTTAEHQAIKRAAQHHERPLTITQFVRLAVRQWLTERDKGGKK